MTGISVGFGLNYRPIEEIPTGFPIPNLGIFTEFSLSSLTPYIFTAFRIIINQLESNPHIDAFNNPPSHPDSPKNPVTSIIVENPINFHI